MTPSPVCLQVAAEHLKPVRDKGSTTMSRLPFSAPAAQMQERPPSKGGRVGPEIGHPGGLNRIAAAPRRKTRRSAPSKRRAKHPDSGLVMLGCGRPPQSNMSKRASHCSLRPGDPGHCPPSKTCQRLGLATFAAPWPPEQPWPAPCRYGLGVRRPTLPEHNPRVVCRRSSEGRQVRLKPWGFDIVEENERAGRRLLLQGPQDQQRSPRQNRQCRIQKDAVNGLAPGPGRL